MVGRSSWFRDAGARTRVARPLGSVLALAALVAIGAPAGVAAGARPSAEPADVAAPAQYAQVQGYIGDAPPRDAPPPPAPAPQEPPKESSKESSKDHEKKVGYVKVHPEDPKDDEKIRLDFKSVSKALNLDKHDGERSDIKEHFRALKGSKVEWSGMVYRVRVGRRGFEIQVKNDSVPTDGTYNIVLKGEEREEAQDIDDDDEIWFTGEIADYKPGRGERGAIVVLTDGDIEKKKSR